MTRRLAGASAKNNYKEGAAIRGYHSISRMRYDKSTSVARDGVVDSCHNAT